MRDQTIMFALAAMPFVYGAVRHIADVIQFVDSGLSLIDRIKAASDTPIIQFTKAARRPLIFLGVLLAAVLLGSVAVFGLSLGRGPAGPEVRKFALYKALDALEASGCPEPVIDGPKPLCDRDETVIVVDVSPAAGVRPMPFEKRVLKTQTRYPPDGVYYQNQTLYSDNGGDKATTVASMTVCSDGRFKIAGEASSTRDEGSELRSYNTGGDVPDGVYLEDDLGNTYTVQATGAMWWLFNRDVHLTDDPRRYVLVFKHLASGVRKVRLCLNLGERGSNFGCTEWMYFRSYEPKEEPSLVHVAHPRGY